MRDEPGFLVLVELVKRFGMIGTASFRVMDRRLDAVVLQQKVLNHSFGMSPVRVRKGEAGEIIANHGRGACETSKTSSDSAKFDS